MAELSDQWLQRGTLLMIGIIHYHIPTGHAYLNSFRDQLTVTVTLGDYFCDAITDTLLKYKYNDKCLYVFEGLIPCNGAKYSCLINDSVLYIKILGIHPVVDTDLVDQINVIREKIVTTTSSGYDGLKNLFMLEALKRMSSGIYKIFLIAHQPVNERFQEPTPPNLAEAHGAFTDFTSNESIKNETTLREAAPGWTSVCKDENRLPDTRFENAMILGTDSLGNKSGVGGELSEPKDEVMVKEEPIN